MELRDFFAGVSHPVGRISDRIPDERMPFVLRFRDMEGIGLLGTGCVTGRHVRAAVVVANRLCGMVWYKTLAGASEALTGDPEACVSVTLLK
jgi:hypothetical protein